MVLSEESKAKSTFVTPFGKFEFICYPSGLAQAVAYFQCLILKEVEFAFGNLDDVLVCSLYMGTHLHYLQIMFERLRKSVLKLKESKCDFLKAHIQYLGHLVSGQGRQPLSEKNR